MVFLWAEMTGRTYNYNGQMRSGTNYLGDLIVCNAKLIHVLFLWNNFQDKEMKMPGRQRKDPNASLQR